MSERTLERQATLTVKRLKKRDEDTNPGVRAELIRCLEDPGYKCAHAACVLCRAQLQASFVDEVLIALGNDEAGTWVTITSLDWQMNFEDLGSFELERQKRWLRRRLGKVLPDGVGIIGAVDFSLNTHDNANIHWQPHVHAFVTGELPKAQQAAIRKAFRPDGASRHRAVQFRSVSPGDLRKTAAYTFKSSFKRRSSFTPWSEAPNGKNSKSLSGPPQPLKAAEDVELQLALQSYRVYDLLFLKGWKRKRTSDPTALNLMKTPKP